LRRKSAAATNAHHLIISWHQTIVIIPRPPTGGHSLHITRKAEAAGTAAVAMSMMSDGKRKEAKR
jgi:hypothetical protein